MLSTTKDFLLGDAVHHSRSRPVPAQRNGPFGLQVRHDSSGSAGENITHRGRVTVRIN